MSDALQVIECRGDPRAMGHAQGRAARAAIRDRVDETGLRLRGRRAYGLAPLISGSSLGVGMGREIIRHYAHLSERIQGLASGSGLSIDSVMELFVRAARGALPDEVCFAESGVVARTGPNGVELLRGVPAAESTGSQWLARRSAPEVGFASVELTLPWIATAIAGVNEAGIAATFVSQGPAPPRSIAPSAALLVQECLQRFESLAGCVDWAWKRPVSGNALLVVAEAAGEFAFVEIRGEDRRLLRSDEAELRVGVDETACVIAEPAARRLRVRLPGAPAEIPLDVRP